MLCKYCKYGVRSTLLRTDADLLSLPIIAFQSDSRAITVGIVLSYYLRRAYSCHVWKSEERGGCEEQLLVYVIKPANPQYIDPHPYLHNSGRSAMLMLSFSIRLASSG